MVPPGAGRGYPLSPTVARLGPGLEASMTTPTYDDGKSRPLGPEALPEPDPRLGGVQPLSGD